MNSKGFSRRAFEHTRRAGLRESPGGPDGPRARRYYYERLAQVSLRHTYYNASEDKCADFDISPTPTTAALLYDLGLFFRREPNGFSVLFNSARKNSLLDYLARQEVPPPRPAGQCWSRLSFVLALNNPYFVNFTDIPIDVNPTERNFYFTNREAHADDDGAVVLNRGDRVAAEELLPVVPTQAALRVPRGAREVLVFDLSGEEVIRAAGCPPDPHAPACVVYLDFSLLPEDKYLVEIRGGDAPAHGLKILYTAASPVPLCFIDLLFTNPTGGEAGVYPVRNLFSPNPEVVPVHYELRFRTRSTVWNYFVVPQPQSEPFDGLRIESVSLPAVEFAGPCCVVLPGGGPAFRFSSEEHIPLQQQSESRFRLLGRRGLMTHEGVLVERLPVASIQQVVPLDAAAACRRLLESLCPDAVSEQRCDQLVGLLCASTAGGRVPARRNYSDTYVYV